VTVSGPPLLAVIGVAGSGKTTVGSALAARLEVAFADADDLHPPANIAKMSAGIPLDDLDRLPWLASVGEWLRGHVRTGAVVSCSALRRRYRDQLRTAAPGLVCIHLAGSADIVVRRVAGRAGHFMPAALVRSQFADLEALELDEVGLTLDLERPVVELVELAVVELLEPALDRAVDSGG
jgi:gluconokinase